VAAAVRTKRTKCYVTALVANFEHSDFFVDAQYHLSNVTPLSLVLLIPI